MQNLKQELAIAEKAEVVGAELPQPSSHRIGVPQASDPHLVRRTSAGWTLHGEGSVVPQAGPSQPQVYD